MIVKYDYYNKEENDTSLNKIGLQTVKDLCLKLSTIACLISCSWTLECIINKPSLLLTAKGQYKFYRLNTVITLLCISRGL